MHQPVLLTEVITGLGLKPGMQVIDCTLGGGGHAEAILKEIGPTGHLLGLDRDQAAIDGASKRLTTYRNHITLVHAPFDQLDTVAGRLGFKEVDAILFDLGFSSNQLDDPERGFSFQVDGPLDMRLDGTDTQTAAEFLHRATERQLADTFYRFGDLYDARRIARQIVEGRRSQRLERTSQLVELLGLKNPGVKAKIFQAIRIAINDEIGQLERALPQAVELLKPGGRIAVISFHSLEDRTVKQFLKANHLLTILTKKPIEPTETEIKANPRSRSAKLRIGEKI